MAFARYVAAFAVITIFVLFFQNCGQKFQAKSLTELASDTSLGFKPPELVATSQPAAVKNTAIVELQFSVTLDERTRLLKAECQVNEEEPVDCSDGVFRYTAAADGDYLIKVVATDNAEQVSEPLFVTTRIDTVAPQISFTQVPSIFSGANAEVVRYQTNDSLSGVAKVECTFDGVKLTSCPNPIPLNQIAEGPHVLKIQAIDFAGNLSSEVETRWTMSLAAPALRFTSAPANYSNSRNVVITYEGTANGRAVTAFECSTNNGVSFNACNGSTTLTDLADGPAAFIVRARDPLTGILNPGIKTEWLTDTVPPAAVRNMAPLAYHSTTRNAAFQFAITDTGGSGISKIECSLGSAPLAVCTGNEIYNGLEDGAYLYTLRVTDRAGNVLNTLYRWTVAATPLPTFTLLGQGAANYRSLATNHVQAVVLSGPDLYAATDGGLSISRDGGQTFSTRSTIQGFDGNVVFDVAVSAPTLFVATDRGLSRSFDGGNTFQSSAGLEQYPAIRKVAASAGDVFVYAQVSDRYVEGQLLISRNGGANFALATAALALPSGYIVSALAADGNDVYVGTTNSNLGRGILYISNDRGFTFTASPHSWDFGLTSLRVTNGVLYAGDRYSVRRSTDKGSTFTSFRIGDGYYPSTAESGSSMYVVVGGDLKISRDGGGSWNESTARLGINPDREDALTVTTRGTDVYVGTTNGLAVSNDNGANFSLRRNTTGFRSGLLLGLAGYDAFLFVAELQSRYRSVNDGVTFDNLATSQFVGPTLVKTVSNTSRGKAVYVVDGGIKYSFDHGVTLQQSALQTSGAIMALAGDGDRVYAGNAFGSYFVSTDAGVTFTERPGVFTLGYGESISALEAKGNLVFAAIRSSTNSARLMASTDGGVTFQGRGGGAYNDYLNGTQRLSIDGANVYAAGRSSLSISRDSGVTFQQSTGGPSLQNRVLTNVLANGRTIYVGTETGLYISTDGGEYFRPLPKTAGIGTGIVTGIQVINGALYVSTRGGVYKSR